MTGGSRGAAGLYWVHGDDLLCCDEATGSLVEKVRAQGAEVRRLRAGVDLDWKALTAECHLPSLFATCRVFDLRVDGGRVGVAGGEALRAIAAAPPPDVMLVLVTVAPERAIWDSAWARAYRAVAEEIKVDTPVGPAFEGWLRARLAQAGVTESPGLVAELAYRYEGNLLAAAQEIARRALAGAGAESAAEGNDAPDESHFSEFAWLEACLAPDRRQALRILARLRGEGAEPILLMTLAARELRTLIALAEGRAAGTPWGALFSSARVWARRQGPLRAAVEGRRRGAWVALLQWVAHLDRVIRGRAAGDPWTELENLTVRFARGPDPKSGRRDW